VAVLALVGALVLVALYRRVLSIPQRPSWPPPPDAVTAAGAQAAVEASPAAPLRFARATAATIEPWVEGARFFPRIFADVEAASSSVHILMFGWKAGAVGTRMAALVKQKLGEGVEVRVLVDRLGSRPYGASRAMFTELASVGAEIVVGNFSPLDRQGLFPDRQRVIWRDGELGRVDHRKLYVVDGSVAWIGGAGLEDHFEDGGFHDVMVRVTGDVVRQSQAAFLAAFRGRGGPPPSDLSRPDRSRRDRSHPRRRGARGDGPRAGLGAVEQRPGRCGAPASVRRACRGGRRGGSSPGRSCTPRSWSPTTWSASAPSTWTPGRSIATGRS
jgi:cardiolipin synthase